MRRSPLHDRLLEAGARFEESSGWENAAYFAPVDAPIDPRLTYGRPDWFEHHAAEHRAVREALSRHEAVSVENLRELELPRLDRLLDAYFTAALDGDLKAAEFVLKISAHRCKLLHLDVHREEQLPTHTIVVGGTKEEFEAALRAGRMQGEGQE